MGEVTYLNQTANADDVMEAGGRQKPAKAVWDISSRKQPALMYGVFDRIRHEHSFAFLFMKVISIYKIPPFS